MRISDSYSKLEGGQLNIGAKLTWEDHPRPAEDIWFKVPGAERNFELDFNAALIACFPIAVYRGERRIALDGPVSPFLVDRLKELHAWWVSWGFARSPMPKIEPQTMKELRNHEATSWTSVGLLSGGVDSLHMLQQNLRNFAKDHRHRIDTTILVTGFDVDMDAEQEKAAYNMASECLSNITRDAGVKLVQVETNLRKLEPNLAFWSKFYHAAVLGSVSHAVIHGHGVSRVAAAFDIPHVVPWGSNPTVDPCFSTERVAIIHEGIIFSRLDKVRDLATWPVAIENLRVCSTIVPGYLNCGFCEKCVRTKLELMAVGLEIPNTFKNRTMEAAQLPVFRIKYQSSCYRDVVVPLKERGHDKLAKAIEQRLLLSPLLNAVKKADEKWTGGNLTKTVRRIKPSAWQKSRM